jgi:hypothetical protein
MEVSDHVALVALVKTPLQQLRSHAFALMFGQDCHSSPI